MRERTTKDGTITYQVLFRDGAKQRSKTFTDHKAATDFSDLIRVLGVRRALAELESSVEAGLTLDELAETFFTWKLARVRSERTITDYRRDYENWIKRPLGWRVASSVDEIDVQEWVDSMVGKIAPKSVHDRHAILHGIFKFGSSPTRALIPVGHNPTIGTELPKKVKKPVQPIRIAEWLALHASLKQLNPDAADLAEFLAASGWRISEAIALSTYDVVDSGGEFVWVNVGQVARRQPDGGVKIVEDAKSEAGLRGMRLDPDASALVRRRLLTTPPGGLVFTTDGGSMWNYSHFRNRFWAKALKMAQIERPLKIHQLRHLNVATLDESGASAPGIKRRIGHESITTTFDTYGGMIGDVSDDVLRRMAEIRRGSVHRELPEVTFEIAD